jgi:transcription termination/antitermination protein NusG
MADKNIAKVRVKAGVLPGVREIKRPDFTKKAADIEKAEAERVLNQGDSVSDEAQAAAVRQSLEAQGESGSDEDQLDESAISDVAKWYVVHTYSGYENKVKEGLSKTVENRHLENQIFEVTIPLQDVYELKNGAKKLTQKKLFPGYVLVNMIMNDETWYVVRNTRGVTGFVGPGSKPVCLTEAEMKNLGIYTAETKVDFAEGDSVAVIAGVWKDTLGIVSKLDYSKQIATISVELFGRETPVEISFAELRKTN